MYKFFFLCLLFLSSRAAAQDPWKDVYKETTWAQRDTWQRPDEIISMLSLNDRGKVADIGCHEGYFTFKLAEAVSRGRVYAVDISRNKIEKLEDHLKERKVKNVHAIVGDPDNPKLPTAALDAVLIVDTYHEIKAHQEMLHRIHMALKPGGKILLCEPISTGVSALSREDQEKKHELGISFAKEDLLKAGFKIIMEREKFVDRTHIKGDTMWVLLAEKTVR